MSAPIARQGDTITGICVGHQIPAALGAPAPSPPLPFNAKVTSGVAPTVLVGGLPVAVTGAQGINLPPHVGLHATDPFLAPPMQVGRVVTGSTTVLAEGKPVATATSTCTCCIGVPGTLAATGATVLVGG